MTFYVKRWHYAGGDSIVGSFSTQESADKEALRLNTEYQTDIYKVEPHDPAKVGDWGSPLSFRELAQSLARY